MARRQVGRTDWTSNASRIIDDRCRASDAFRAAYAETERRVAALYATMRDLPGEAFVARMTEIGGWTKLITETFTACCGDATVAGGMYGKQISVATGFRPTDVQNIRIRVMTGRVTADLAPADPSASR